MIKRISHLAIIYAFLFGSAIFLQSCCDETIRIVGNGEMIIYNSNINDPSNTDEHITGIFAVYSAPETVISNVAELVLMSSAFATSCDYDYANRLMQESIVLTCDRAFELGGMTIAAGTDLIGLEGVESLPSNNSIGNQDALVSFNDTFIDQVVFEETEYTFTINMSTNDGLAIVNSATAVFRL